MNKHGVMVLGIGNPLCRDDGIGIRVIEEMRKQDEYGGIRLIDGGTSPDLISLLDKDVERIIIVDALQGGGLHGDIYHLDLREENIADGAVTSLHELGVLDSLKLIKKLGQQPPQVTVIGIEPADTSHGLHLSPVIEAKLPDIMRAVKSEIERLD
ncbi:MAG: hydrogenase maturation protease [Dehalococcoidia bacterium]|nr:hydrogenase maturation protease [Dehalococcoidia bacterium]